MKIDLHIHSKNGSDGRWTLRKIFEEASNRAIEMISITDHDAINSQSEAISHAGRLGIRYLTGVELNVTFSHRSYREGKRISLDFLGYGYDHNNERLCRTLEDLRIFRESRAVKILDNINTEFRKEGRSGFTHRDIEAIQASVDGSFGRPHIADYMARKGIVRDRQEAFDKYLVKCDVPKLPLALEEASDLIRGAGGLLVLAHPNDPNGTSLASLTKSMPEQQAIIREAMLPYLDGIECWHSRHTDATSEAYVLFCRQEGLIATGGSDCHQQPVLMGTVDIPDQVAGQFQLYTA